MRMVLMNLSIDRSWGWSGFFLHSRCWGFTAARSMGAGDQRHSCHMWMSKSLSFETSGLNP